MERFGVTSLPPEPEEEEGDVEEGDGGGGGTTTEEVPMAAEDAAAETAESDSCCCCCCCRTLRYRGGSARSAASRVACWLMCVFTADQNASLYPSRNPDDDDDAVPAVAVLLFRCTANAAAAGFSGSLGFAYRSNCGTKQSTIFSSEYNGVQV